MSAWLPKFDPCTLPCLSHTTPWIGYRTRYVSSSAGAPPVSLGGEPPAPFLPPSLETMAVALTASSSLFSLSAHASLPLGLMPSLGGLGSTSMGGAVGGKAQPTVSTSIAPRQESDKSLTAPANSTIQINEPSSSSATTTTIEALEPSSQNESDSTFNPPTTSSADAALSDGGLTATNTLAAGNSEALLSSTGPSDTVLFPVNSMGQNGSGVKLSLPLDLTRRLSLKHVGTRLSVEGSQPRTLSLIHPVCFIPLPSSSSHPSCPCPCLRESLLILKGLRDRLQSAARSPAPASPSPPPT